MKCLFINPDYPPPLTGGSVVYYYYLHTVFLANELVVLTAAAHGAEIFDVRRPYQVIRKRYIKWTSFDEPLVEKAVNLVRRFFAAWRLIISQDIDVIHIGHFYPGAFKGWLLSVVTGRPFVLTVMGEDLTGLRQAGPIRRALTLFSLQKAAKVFTISSYCRSLLINCDVPSDKITLVTPGVELGKCNEDTIEEPNYWLSIKGKKVILTVGRLTKRKGQDMVLKALPEVITRIPDAHYLIAGSGLEEEALKSLTSELGLVDHVTFVPDATDQEIGFLYKNCKLFIMPNRELPNGDTEGFGIVFLEAGWWGKPVIGGRDGGVPEAVEDGVSGLLVDGNDIDQIGNAILRLLGDAQLRERMGQAGRLKALANGWEQKSAQLRAVLQEATGT